MISEKHYRLFKRVFSLIKAGKRNTITLEIQTKKAGLKKTKKSCYFCFIAHLILSKN